MNSKVKKDPQVVAAEKAIEKALVASEKAKEMIVAAAANHKHPRQLNKARSATHDSVMALGRAGRWIGRWNKLQSN